MLRILTLGVAAALALSSAGAVQAQPMQPATPAPMGGPAMGGPALSTPDYVTTAARSDMFEIAEARMALHHTSNPHIREFAQMMIRDHSKSTAMIKAALTETGRPVPPPPGLGADQQEMIATLRGSGPNFDRVYIDQQVRAHMKALEVHAGYARGGQNLALQRTANRIVPVVRRHLAMARDIRSHMS